LKFNQTLKLLSRKEYLLLFIGLDQNLQKVIEHHFRLIVSHSLHIFFVLNGVCDGFLVFLLDCGHSACFGLEPHEHRILLFDTFSLHIYRKAFGLCKAVHAGSGNVE